MSINYSSSLRIKALFNPSNIRYLFLNAQKEGCIFLSDGKPISFDQTLQQILAINEDGFSLLSVRCHDTYFSFLLSANESTFFISMVHYTFNNWNQEFPYAYRRFVDNARYLRLLLKICKDFDIADADIYTDEDPILEKELENTLSVALLKGSNEREYEKDMYQFLLNAYQHAFKIVYNKKIIEFDELENYSKFLAHEFIKTRDLRFALFIEDNIIDVHFQNYMAFITFLPLQPFKIDENKQNIDVAFYTEAVLCFCENFGIQELKTHFSHNF